MDKPTDDRDRLAQADALIDWVIEAWESLRPGTLTLWQANWLEKARAYSEGGEERS